jgi:hypothetical protein
MGGSAHRLYLPPAHSGLSCRIVIVEAQKFWVLFLERLSFLLWIGFTIFSVVLVGIGVMSIMYAGIILIGSGAVPARLPLVDTRWAPAALSETSLSLPLVIIGAGIAASFFSLIWRQIGIDHFHYSEMDLLVSSREAEETLSSTLDRLIHEVEESSGDDRTLARARAKAWLLSHGADLDEEEIVLVRIHFSYLLPAGWGL